MQNSERQPFDNNWQSAFDGAEMAPPDRLWHSIEAEVAGGEAATMKKRVVFYQRLAAATVTFAMLTGAYAIYNYTNSPAEIATSTREQKVVEVPQAQESPTKVAAAETPKASAADGNTNTSRSDVTAPRTTSTKGKSGSTDRTGNTADAPPPVVALADNNSTGADKHNQETEATETREAETVIAMTEQPQQTAEVSDQTTKEETTEVQLPSAEQINAVAEAEAKKEKENAGSDRLPWLGVGAAAGSFTPSAVVGGLAAAEANYSLDSSTPTPQSQSESVGSAISAGVSAGLRISKRWVIQSGLNYINQQVDYATNFVGVSSSNQATAMTKDYMSSSSLYTAVVNPYEVSSATEILSIPVQAGYMIVDRRIGWQVNSGVSTDFLLRNTLTDKSGTRSRITEGAGEDSPYRAVNWAALLNTEVSYQFGDHYRLAVVPGLRYSFQPMLKGSSAGTPLILDIGFRFKYMFQ